MSNIVLSENWKGEGVGTHKRMDYVMYGNHCSGIALFLIGNCTRGATSPRSETNARLLLTTYATGKPLRDTTCYSNDGDLVGDMTDKVWLIISSLVLSPSPISR